MKRLLCILALLAFAFTAAGCPPPRRPLPPPGPGAYQPGPYHPAPGPGPAPYQPGPGPYGHPGGYPPAP